MARAEDGAIVEEVLSLDLVQKLADALPGLIKVALRPPVSADAVAAGSSEADASSERDASLGALNARYERELMNPKEALSLGSVSQIVMPSDLRQILAEHMLFHLTHYEPGPLMSVQREFH